MSYYRLLLAAICFWFIHSFNLMTASFPSFLGAGLASGLLKDKQEPLLPIRGTHQRWEDTKSEPVKLSSGSVHDVTVY